MFLHVLTRDQQIAFARAAVHLVHADEVFDDREAALLETIRHEMGMKELPEDPGRDAVLTDLEVLDSGVSKRVALFELTGISTADGAVHTEEMEVLRDVARHLDVDEGDLGTFVDYAQRAHEIYREGRKLVAGEGLTVE